MIAVSRNVGSSTHLIKPAKLYMCTQNTTNTARTDARRRVCAAMVPYCWVTRETSLRELDYNNHSSRALDHTSDYGSMPVYLFRKCHFFLLRPQTYDHFLCCCCWFQFSYRCMQNKANSAKVEVIPSELFKNTRYIRDNCTQNYHFEVNHRFYGLNFVWVRRRASGAVKRNLRPMIYLPKQHF